MSEEQSFEYKYIYDDDTHELLRTIEVEKDRWGDEVIYPCETRVEPPECQDNEIQVFSPSLNLWTIEEDHRGKEVYENGIQHQRSIWRSIGKLPSNMMLTYYSGADTLSAAKDDRCQEINRLKDVSRDQGVYYNGHVYEMNVDSFQIISAYEAKARLAISTGEEFIPVPWTTKTNEDVSLTGDDFIQLLKAYADRSTLLHDRAQYLKKLVRAVEIPKGDGSTEDNAIARERIAIDEVYAIPISFDVDVVSSL